MITLAIIAKHSANSFQTLVDLGNAFLDEVVVAVDDGADEGIDGYRACKRIRYYSHPLANNFAAQRNFIVEKATQPWILHLDTDESMSPWLLERLAVICDATVEDLIMLPRANRYIGHFDTLVNWPDWQPKLHRSHVRWHLPVHEWPIGYKGMRHLPLDERYAIQHVKTAEMQEKANALYHAICPDTN